MPGKATPKPVSRAALRGEADPRLVALSVSIQDDAALYDEDIRAANGNGKHATEQFQIADARSPREVAELIRKLGYEPVWKDWDAALTA